MISIDLLRELVSYNPETGDLTWLPRRPEFFKNPRDCAGWNTKYAGKRAFTTKNFTGYLCGHIFKKTYMSHRIAWALHHGSWPDKQIDHIDGVRANNKIENLRAVSAEDNQKNVKQRVDNTSGAKGVDFQKSYGLWRARIVHNKRRIDLGKFRNLDDAIAARKAAERQYGYHENHGRAA